MANIVLTIDPAELGSGEVLVLLLTTTGSSWVKVYNLPDELKSSSLEHYRAVVDRRPEQRGTMKVKEQCKKGTEPEGSFLDEHGIRVKFHDHPANRYYQSFINRPICDLERYKKSYMFGPSCEDRLPVELVATLILPK